MAEPQEYFEVFKKGCGSTLTLEFSRERVSQVGEGAFKAKPRICLDGQGLGCKVST